jgi:hypothetical protein
LKPFANKSRRSKKTPRRNCVSSFKSKLQRNKVFAEPSLLESKIDWNRIPRMKEPKESLWVLGFGSLICAGMLFLMVLWPPGLQAAVIVGAKVQEQIGQLAAFIEEGGIR